MSLKDKIYERQSDRRLPLLAPLSVAVEVKADIDPSQPPGLFVHELRAMFGIEFTANHAQMDEAKKTAMRMVFREIYGEIEALTDEVMRCSYVQDFQGVSDAISEIKDICRGIK